MLSFTSRDTNETIPIKFTCFDKNSFDWNIDQNNCYIINGLQEVYQINKTQKNADIELIGSKPGSQTLIAHVRNNFTKSVKNQFELKKLI